MRQLSRFFNILKVLKILLKELTKFSLIKDSNFFRFKKMVGKLVFFRKNEMCLAHCILTIFSDTFSHHAKIV